MFLEHHVPVPQPFAAARDALLRITATGELATASQLAFTAGSEALLRVGPNPHVTKLVHARWLSPTQKGGTLTVPLRWEATGPAGALFPTMDANLGLTAVDDTSSLLSVVACYTPPFGAFGSQLDRTVLHRAARATMHALLADLAGRLCTNGTKVLATQDS
jgi:hypothetical protein